MGVSVCACVPVCLSRVVRVTFYNSAITKPIVCACIVVEMGSHLTKKVPVKSHNDFSRLLVEKGVV